METKAVFLLLTFLSFSNGESDLVDYNGTLFLNKEDDDDEQEFWSPPSKSAPTDVMLSPSRVNSFKNLLDSVGARYDVIINDLEHAIQNERLNSVASSRNNGRRREEMNWNEYQRLSTIHRWMDSLAVRHPGTVTIFRAGNSSEGRPLKVMKISTGDGYEQKPAIWIDGGIHAREWIAPATATFIANLLVKQAINDGDQGLTKYFDFYIHPVMNPDGYEFTQVNRMWRKTRSGPRGPKRCRGADPNRNWNYQWGGEGTSNDPCSDIYRGPRGASEPEVERIQEFIMERKDQIKLFLTFHSYGQVLLLPWGYDDIHTNDNDELMKVGRKALVSLERVHGTQYRAGTVPEIFYSAAGGSIDWAKGVAGIKFSYCYELRDNGDFGFILPADQIIPTGEETFKGVQSMAEDMIGYFRLNPRMSEIGVN